MARRSNSQFVPFLLIVILLIIGAVLVLRNNPDLLKPQQQSQEQTTAVPANVSPNLLLGNPSEATTDPSNKNNYLMEKKYFTLSYNNEKGIPNWVSWQVTMADLGDAARKRLFDPDEELPAGFRRITHQDYNGSGFDRGHMCPHSDRAANEDMSFATFVMTNIIPQAPNVNQKAWAHLEMYCRSLVRQHHERLYIQAGPAGQGGAGEKGFKETIGQRNKVVVPAECWKIIVVVPAGGGENDLAKINANTRVITVLMPNDNKVGDAWAPYRTTPAEVEKRTGFHFFTNLPGDVVNALRQKVDTIPVSSQEE